MHGCYGTALESVAGVSCCLVLLLRPPGPPGHQFHLARFTPIHQATVLSSVTYSATPLNGRPNVSLRPSSPPPPPHAELAVLLRDKGDSGSPTSTALSGAGETRIAGGGVEVDADMEYRGGSSPSVSRSGSRRTHPLPPITVLSCRARTVGTRGTLAYGSSLGLIPRRLITTRTSATATRASTPCCQTLILCISSQPTRPRPTPSPTSLASGILSSSHSMPRCRLGRRLSRRCLLLSTCNAGRTSWRGITGIRGIRGIRENRLEDQ